MSNYITSNFTIPRAQEYRGNASACLRDYEVTKIINNLCKTVCVLADEIITNPHASGVSNNFKAIRKHLVIIDNFKLTANKKVRSQGPGLPPPPAVLNSFL
jgi:hypothetical protein